MLTHNFKLGETGAGCPTFYSLCVYQSQDIAAVISVEAETILVELVFILTFNNHQKQTFLFA